MPDQKSLLVKIVPRATLARRRPSRLYRRMPSIQETNGQGGESSTYEVRDTLNSKHDEDLFDYYASICFSLPSVDCCHRNRYANWKAREF